jgi:hypothetical protein
MEKEMHRNQFEGNSGVKGEKNSTLYQTEKGGNSTDNALKHAHRREKDG